MNATQNCLVGHVLLCGPVEVLDALERRHRIRCAPVPSPPREVFVSYRHGSAFGWDRISVPAPRPGAERMAARRFVVEGRPSARHFLRTLRGRADSLAYALDYEVRGQDFREGLHGGPTPDRAVRLEAAADEDYLRQAAFERIGLTARRRHHPRGEGVTVAIFDSAPDLEDGTPPVDPALIDVWAEWPRIPEGFPLLEPVHVPDEEPECGMVLRRRLVTASALAADDRQMAAYRAHHGPMIASLVRQVAPGAHIILVRVLNGALGALTYELIEAMRWVDGLRRTGVTNPRTGRPLVAGPLVYNLSLGLDRSQPETVQSCVLLAAADGLARQGTVLVCAAGNLSEGRPENCLEPAAYGYFGDTLAASTQVIPVGAASSAAADRYAWFSNESHVAEPGEDLVLDCGRILFGSRYVRWSGTSFAAPLVAGVAALWLSAGLPAAEVKQRLWNTALRPSRWDGVHLLQASS
ncbi:MAG: S8/S53 family peptidase [Armatimonadota bacterium]|nr:S8/S53 family peptidase [Armatimonadota bacterium]